MTSCTFLTACPTCHEDAWVTVTPDYPYRWHVDCDCRSTKKKAA